MEANELLNQLNKVAESGEKRIDQYIRMSQQFLKSSPEWNERYNQIFQEMLKEIQVSRKIKNIATGAVIFLVIVLIGVMLSSYFLKKQKDSDIALIETARNAQLALQFRGVTDSWLEVSVDTGAVSDPKLKGRLAKILAEFPSLGRHYGLGLQKHLKLKRNSENTWYVLPETNDVHQVLGFVELHQAFGKVDFLNKRVELNEEIRYDEVNDFYIKITGYKRRNPEIPEDVEWGVIFGEREANGEILWNTEPVHVNQSINGSYVKEPFVLTHPSWQRIYVVSIGIGRLGTDREIHTDFAWNLRSFVRAFSLD